MNLNTQFSFTPNQPDNPSDSDRFNLLKYALVQRGWPEDIYTILKHMAPPPPITEYADPGSFHGVRVGVIGGGLAGLSSAYELRKLGFDVTIFDALEDRVGGRIYTYYFDNQPNLYHEFGPMRIPVSHETVWHYLKQFGLPTKPFIQYDPNGYAYLKGVRVRNDRNGRNVMQYIYPKYSLKPWEQQTSWEQLLNIGLDNHLLNATTQERAEILEVKKSYSQKTMEWIDRANISMMESGGLSQEAIDLVTNFIPLLKGNLNNSFIDFIQENYPANLDYLYEIPGGMVKFPLAFYNSFCNDKPYNEIPASRTGTVVYKKGCWVKGIHLHDDGKKVKLSYQILQAREKAEEEFDYIVCTIPFSTLRNVDINPLFSNIKMRAITEVNYTPSQKSLMLCRERFWERDGIVGGASLTDLPIGSIWFPSDHSIYVNNPGVGDLKNLPWKQPGVIIGSFNFGLDTTRLTNQPEGKIFEEVKREIEAVQGLAPGYMDYNAAGFKTVNWNQEPTFRGAISFFTPQQKKLFAYGMTIPEYNGRVFFAGEHISAVHRWMQGALQTGMQAANDLVMACMKR